MEKLKGAPHAENNVPLKFMIDGKMYETFDQYKTGQHIKSLAGIPLETELYLLIDEPYEDELIENDTSVNLARPEVERFVVKKKLRFYICTWFSAPIRLSGISLKGSENQGLKQEKR